jgi:hypothetical protein
VIGRLAFVLLLVFAAARSVAAVELGLPVDCTPGRDCFIQNYVDNDPGPGRRDYACGPLSYDGHVGTDFRVPDRAAMLRGVAVVAAAPGVVRATRDGMADISIRETGREAVAGREAGNSVLIDHGDGWETQYSHLRRDSVRVHPGDRVKAGAVLGLIGLSGLRAGRSIPSSGPNRWHAERVGRACGGRKSGSGWPIRRLADWRPVSPAPRQRPKRFGAASRRRRRARRRPWCSGSICSA